MDKFAYLKALRADDRLPAEVRLTNAEFRTLVMIFNYTDHDCRNARPSAERLATEIGITRTLVWRHIKALKQKGYLIVTSAGGPAGTGARKANTYALTLPFEVVNFSFTTGQLSGEPEVDSTDERGLHHTEPSGEPEVHQVVNVGFTSSGEPHVPPIKSLSNQEQSTAAANADALPPRKGWRQIFAEHQPPAAVPQPDDATASPTLRPSAASHETLGSTRTGGSDACARHANPRPRDLHPRSEQDRTRIGLLSVTTSDQGER